ncbi:hypothetical protein A3C57_02030 [Candidatus Nomurabacteria bacterium RIFCSPHIGHO2_02_FULL_33_12]|uniref:NYN domain-containing protein n=1 Tax=Candidatus Nomurabacteria bacterium RIFCSPLOWO2_01_FULL_33_17 TaxID=1801764 RepID=A0A1F6WPA9_9BACT|nr:MAG: hypothetical protein A3C57_02030 [Candidatus Nomurabacteria bacterium RIFCSPHIGHO2_02_FULL_33_12]OGI83676.1 MAG: hypothetical protein A2903_01300 [Candidatus Nomurabacteria bacterium RIFCSPLOWO2_01_FULL_33_17]
MIKKNNYAFIDGANLHQGMNYLGWEIDYKKLRVWLTDKFNITIAYIFLGNIPKYGKLYAYLQECGFILIFKEVVYDNTGKPKGNCDADLVLKATQDFYNKSYDNMLLVSSDGDYSSLISFLLSEKRLVGILSPANEKKCSILLKRTGSKIYYISDQKNIIKK